MSKDEAFYTQNAIDDEAHIHVDNLLNRYTGDGIKIAIIDDGLDVYHEDLSSSVIATYDITTKTTDVSHSTQMKITVQQ